MNFIRSNLIHARPSATEVLSVDLPTNPISHLILAISGFQMTDEATLAEILAFLNTVTVSQLGTTILNLQSEDLHALNCYLYRSVPALTNSVTTDNATRTLGLVIPFGRRIFDPQECYPATKKGELTLTLDLTALGTSIDNGVIDLDCVQLIGAQPTHYLKSRIMTVTAPGATGVNEVALPIGNEIVAIGIRMTTFPGVSSHVYGVEKATILVDDIETDYSAAVAQCLVADRAFRATGPITSMLQQQQMLPLNTVWLDFDPNGDGQFLLDTKGKSSVKIALDMGVNEATYLTVVERVPVAA